jgi:hippurate hydrolase
MSINLESYDIEQAVKWRREFHRYPELAFEEKRTSDTIARLLSSWGYRVTEGVAKTGIIATVGNGGGPKLALRSDIDALPIEEQSDVPWASKIKGKMHACGHDGHMAMLLLAAQYVAQHIETTCKNGSLGLIFQPAEEAEAGAKAMIEDGLFDRFDCDSIYAIHNWPSLKKNAIVARNTEMMAAFATFEINLRGRGGHAAMPEQSDDIIAATARLATALQEIPARSLSPLDPGVVSITAMQSGDTWNVCPARAVLRGTCRWFSQAAGNALQQRLQEVANGIAQAYNLNVRIDYERRYPATINNANKAKIIRDVAERLDLNVIEETQPSMASEDFSFMLNKKDGAYVWLGAEKPGENPGLHHPKFDFNDQVLPTGANLWVNLVKETLG